MKSFLKRKMSMRVQLVFFVFIIMLISQIIIAGIAAILLHLGYFSGIMNERGLMIPILSLLIFSILVGTLLATFMGKRMLKSTHNFIKAMNQVSTGDFSVQLDVSGTPEMEILAKNFNTMVRELGSIETLRSDFISNFSHEFKTPIVSIRGFAKLLQDETLDEKERREYIEIIIQESERLAGLSTNVLNLSKVENIEILTEKNYFFLDEQIRRTAALMAPAWQKKTLSVGLEMDSITMYSDEELLQQVWVNLLDNAIKFTDEGGHIRLFLKRQGANAVFCIADDGCGMDENTMTHLFDKFYQGDSSHTGLGNGLGLSLVRRIVDLCGGQIAAESRPGEGSMFTVTLPIGSREEREETSPGR